MAAHPWKVLTGAGVEVDLASIRGGTPLYVGGRGTMWDFPNDPDVSRVGRTIYEAGGIVAAVCHGPSTLVNLRLSDGSHLINDKAVAGYTNGEEEPDLGCPGVVPVRYPVTSGSPPVEC